MKTENEIENSKKRIELLESQNARIKKLLESALEITKKPKTDVTIDENDFWQETIRLIENEKIQMQEDLKLLASIENVQQRELLVTIRKLEAENTELQKKIDFLLQQSNTQSNKIDKLNTELTEFKFLITQPQTNIQCLKNILLLDDTVTENASALLLEERYKLQSKIVKLESKKYELLAAIEDISQPGNDKNCISLSIRSDMEKALSKAISEVAKREFENLHIKVLELEQERSKLLSDLQAVLDQSRQEIANQYYKLQQNILQIETEKGNLKSSSKTTIKTLGNSFEDENEEVDSILDAFSNKQRIDLKGLRSISFQETSEARRYLKVPLPTCVIL